MTKKAEDLIEDAQDAIGYLDMHLSDAQDYCAKIQRLLNELSDIQEVLPSSASLKEAASFGIQAMINKYGHSSKEVREVESYIASKP